MSELSKCAKRIEEIGDTIDHMRIKLVCHGEEAPEALTDAIRISIMCGLVVAQYEVEHPGETDPETLAINAVDTAINRIIDGLHEEGDDE